MGGLSHSAMAPTRRLQPLQQTTPPQVAFVLGWLDQHILLWSRFGCLGLHGVVFFFRMDFMLDGVDRMTALERTW